MTHKASVLIVDDNHDAADLLGEALRTCGYAVAVAHTSLDALARLESFHPDAALLDIGLPQLDGYQLAHELHARFPALPVIAVTGYGQPADRERALEAGFAEHLVKPATITDVVATLDRLVGSNKAADE